MKAFGAFSAKGEWFRGNCHTHTKLSDGQLSAAETVEAYRSRGYHFMVFTDHRLCRESVEYLQREDFLVINGIELHPPARSRPFINHHIIGIGVEKNPNPRLIEKGSAETAVRWIKRNGGIAVYCHPYWSGHHISHMREGRGAFGVEVYNSTTEAVRGLGDASAHLDQALSQGFPWKAFAVDDTHRIERDGFGGWIMVKAAKLTRANVMRAILKGNFYATNGPEIYSLSLKRNIARIECSPVKQVVWHCVGPCGIRETAAGGSLTVAEFDLSAISAQSRYVRIEIMDANGRKAWSNPVWWDQKTRRWND